MDKDNYPVLIHCYHGTGRAEMYSVPYRVWEFTNEAASRSEKSLKFSSFDDGTPKENTLRRTRKESGSKTNDLKADTILNGI
jgi:hypothetical protein